MERLVERGWDCTIIAASTEHPSGRQRVSRESIWTRGVQWRFLKCPAYSGNGLARVLNMLAYTIRAFRITPGKGTVQPDIVLGSTVHPLAALAGLRVARRCGVPFIFEIQDLWPETLIAMGAVRRNSLPARVLGRLEGYLCRSASSIVTTMLFAHEYLSKQYGLLPEKIVWISMGTEVERFHPSPVRESPDPFVFMYFGSHGAANNLTLILDGFALLQESIRTGPAASPKSRLVLVGGGPQKTMLVDRARAHNLGNRIEFRSPAKKGDIPKISQEADCFVLSLLPLSIYKYGISMNKLFDYLAASRPTILVGDPINNPVLEGQAGISTPDASPQGVCDAMLRMMEADYDVRTKWARSARTHVSERYSYESLSMALEELLLKSLREQ